MVSTGYAQHGCVYGVCSSVREVKEASLASQKGSKESIMRETCRKGGLPRAIPGGLRDYPRLGQKEPPKVLARLIAQKRRNPGYERLGLF